jgi:uncharacterized lipoprotein YmbA
MNTLLQKHLLKPTLLVLTAGLILTGCLLRSSNFEPRRFVLTPLPASERVASAGRDVSLSVSPVQLPGYLSRRALMVRQSASEVDFRDDAIWAERLEDGFQRVLVANLSLLVPSSQVEPSGGEHSQVRVLVTLEQFDVDKDGRGTLTARWRLSAPGKNQPLKTGETRLTRSGPAPANNPQAIPETLSALTADFSKALVQTIRENTP